MKYERPKLVALSSMNVEGGGPKCDPTGSDAGGDCIAGTSAGGSCQNGTAAATCQNGGSPAVCVTGVLLF